MNYGKELLQFIEKSPTAYQAVETVREELDDQGFQELQEGDAWELVPGGRYYVIRNYSSLLAFVIPQSDITGFQMGASHSDSPTFRLKPEMELETTGRYLRINAEPYGGAIFSTWQDRPLSVAGRVMVEEEDRVETRLVCVDRDLLLIPSVAIHMNRQVNEGTAFKAHQDVVPLFAGGKGKGRFMEIVAEAAGTTRDQILGMDLYLYNRTPGMLWGVEEEFVSAPRLDDLQCAFALLKGFNQARESSAVPVYALFDNEEVGSLTKQGADSGFLEHTLRRICLALGKNEEEYMRILASSFLVSADNAHAIHPNHPEYSDPVNYPVMNGGIAIKFNGRQNYTSDGVSEALFRMLMRKAGVPCQNYTNRSDMPGGSTLGNLSNRHVSMNAVDIGLPQLAMHSCYETAGTRDMADLISVMELFYSCSLEEIGTGIYRWN